MSRRNLARLILIVWIVALGWLAQRQFFQGEGARLAAGAARLPPDARYYQVLVGDLQVGTVNMMWDTLPTGFRMSELVALDIPSGTATVRQIALAEHTTSRALTWQRTTRTLAGGGISEESAAQAVTDSVVMFRVAVRDLPVSPSSTAHHDVRPTMALLLPMRLAFADGLRPGATIAMQGIDLERQTILPMRAVVQGERTFVVADSVELDSITGIWRTVTEVTIPTWEVAVTAEGGEERWWVDHLGRLVRREFPLGVTLQMSPFDYAQTAYRDTLNREGPGARTWLPGLRSLAASRLTLDTLAAEVRYEIDHVGGGNPARFADALATGTQAVHGDTLVVARRWREGGDPVPERDRAVTSRVSSGRIRAAADSALRGVESRRDSIVALTGWVGRRIARDTSAARQRDAIGVSRTGSAGPEGMAALLVAMARGVGLEARQVSGLAVTDEGLLAHAWAEVWTGAEWTPVDPWSGHAPASARLVRIGGGGLGRPFEILLRAGALRLEPIIPEVR